MRYHNFMTKEEARKIFESWRAYMEIADKLRKLFVTIPESFLPYPKDILEEALAVIAKDYLDNGHKEKAETIQLTIHGYLRCHEKDETALEGMRRVLDLMLKSPDLMKVKINSLHESRDSWAKRRENKE